MYGKKEAIKNNSLDLKAASRCMVITDDYSVAEREMKMMQYDSIAPSRLTELYRMSRSTILRDEKVVRAIDRIGEIAPGAKRKILCGEAKIKKTVLRKIPDWPEDDVVQLAMNIENETFDKSRYSYLKYR